MASATVNARCIIYGKEKATSKCAGCLQDFCYRHLGDHRQGLGKQLDEIEVMQVIFRQTVNEQKSNVPTYSFIHSRNRSLETRVNEENSTNSRRSWTIILSTDEPTFDSN